MSALDRAMEGSVPAPDTAILARFPATPNQLHVWQDMALPEVKDGLNATFLRRLEGKISDFGVITALQGLVDRHEILRTRLRIQADGKLMQEVLRKLAFKPDLVDLRHLPSPRREAELERLGAAQAREPFVLTDSAAAAPLFRVLLVRLAPDLAYLHFTFHQLVIDGWSVDVLEEEFGRLATAADSGEVAELPAVDMQFGDYALWLNDVLTSPALDGQRDYWRKQLSSMPRFEIAPDRPGPRGDCEGQIRSLLLPHALSSAFEALARANNHTIFSLATAAVAAALHLVSGESEVVLGTQTAGRDDPDAERIVGSLLNTVVLRLPVRPAESFLDYAQRVRGVTHEAMDNQLLPFAEVAQFARDETDARRSPLYSINLVVQHTQIKNARTADRDFGGFRMAPVPGPSAGVSWDLSFFMVGREEGWRLSCEGATALYDTGTLDALLAVWRKVIEGAVARPQAMLANLASLEDHERRLANQTPGTVTDATCNVFYNPRQEALKERIIVLQSQGDKVPIIAINNASLLYPVARAIGRERAFHDLQFCPSPRRVALPRRHFSDHARDAVEMIRLAQPRGPYVLFGLCIFGAIALEAARILQSEGEVVPLVILADTYRPGFRERMSFLDRCLRTWQVRVRSFNALRMRVASGELTKAQWIDNYRLLRRLKITKMFRGLGVASLGAEHDPLQDNNRWFPEEVLLPSQTAFDFERYSGDVLLFRNLAMQPGRLFPHDFGWTGHIDGQLEIIEVPGTHDTIFRSEGAAVIGPAIRRRLAALGY